jgi:hypothetical protein
MLVGPGLGREVFCLPVRRVGQSGEDVAQIRIRIETAPAATLNDGVEDGASFPGLGFADEQPVLLSQRGGTDLTPKSWT